MVAAQSVSPVGRASRDDRTTLRVDPQHGRTNAVFGKTVVAQTVIVFAAHLPEAGVATEERDVSAVRDVLFKIVSHQG